VALKCALPCLIFLTKIHS